MRDKYKNFYKQQDYFTLQKIKPKFSLQFIMAVDNWQSYGASDKSTLKDILKLKVPNKYKTCDKPIYRVMGIDKDSEFITPHIGSWTLDLNIAKNFITSDWFKINNNLKEKDIVLLKVGKPKKSNIILNIDSLWQDEFFMESIFYYEQVKNYHSEGSGLDFEDLQREVIYKSDKINRSQIELFFDLKNKKWKRKT